MTNEKKRISRCDQRKYHYIYKITRDDGKYYIGLHSTDDLDDGYFGSGQALWKSIKAHGKEKHKKEILEFLPSRKLLIQREEELVNEDVVKDGKSLNLRKGGSYPYRKPDHPNSGKNKSASLKAFYSDIEKSAEARRRISEKNTGKKRTQKHKAILSQVCAKTVARLKETGEWARVVEENRIAHTGKIQSKETIDKRNALIKITKQTKYGGKYTFSEQARKNIGEAQRGNEKNAKTWRIELQNQEPFIVKNITKWYRETGIIHRKDKRTLKDQSGSVIGVRSKV
jgi:hypothetical protein